MLCVSLFCVTLVARMKCHVRGLVPCDNLQLLIFELVCLVMTAELMMTLQINEYKLRFLVSRYVFIISTSRSSIKVMRSRSSQCNTHLRLTEVIFSLAM